MGTIFATEVVSLRKLGENEVCLFIFLALENKNYRKPLQKILQSG
jgi:hypothetical protein